MTQADLVTGTLPAGVKELTDAGDAWVSRSAGGHTPPPPSRRPVGPADSRSPAPRPGRDAGVT